MSVLTEPFPTKLIIDGAECPINSGFRTVLRCYELQGDSDVLSGNTLIKILQLFYEKKCRLYTQEHIDRMLWFFACGRKKKSKRFPRKIAGLNDKQPFDFEEDADLIYAGFMQQYGIDLQEENMHWWKFMILLENLGSETRLQKIMEFRTLDTGNKNFSKDQRKFYQAMQQYYGLKIRIPAMTDKEKLIEEALLNGGDVSKLLGG